MREEVTGGVPAGDERLAGVEAEIADDDAGWPGHEPRPYALTAILPILDPHPVYFAEAVASVFAQTSDAWRLVVVAEEQEVERISTMLGAWAHDPRVTVGTNRGVRLAGAINTAMEIAESEFVALLLGDDLWEPDAVAVLSTHIRLHPGTDFFHTGRRYVDDDGLAISGVYRPRSQVTLDDFRERTPVKHLLCWRRSMGLAIGVDERFHATGADDLDFPWVMAEHGARFRAVDHCCYVYRDHRDGTRLTTHQHRKAKKREMVAILRKHGLGWRERRRRVRAEGRVYLRQSRYRSALHRQLSLWLRRAPVEWREPYR